MYLNEVNGCGMVSSVKRWLACIAGGHGLNPWDRTKAQARAGVILVLPEGAVNSVPLADLRLYKHLVL